MWIKKGWPRPPAADGIQIFDNDDQSTKHWKTKNKYIKLFSQKCLTIKIIKLPVII